MKIDSCVPLGVGVLTTSVLVMSAIVAMPFSCLAQLTPDASLGAEQSVVGADQTIQGLPSNVITGGAVRGVNLFHSFQDFNVGVNRGVFFANPTLVENIFTRVTGGNPSDISGRLGVLGGANLYLLNPSGIVFGAGASLDVQGSFFASTASSIDLGNGEVFSAIAPLGVPLITVQPNATFLNALGAITNQATLQTGQGLILNGTTLTNTGTLQAGTLLSLNGVDVVNQGIAQAGTDLSLQGNSITSSGTLLAPNGNLTATAVAGNIAIQQLDAQTATLSASNTIALNSSQFTIAADLSLTGTTIQITDTAAAPANLGVGGNFSISGQTVAIDTSNNPGSLIQTNGNLTIASSGGIAARGTLTTDGSVLASATGGLQLADSQITSTTGSINLSTTGNAVLDRSQLQAATDLTVFSQGVLRIRDSVATPFTATAGDNITLQGINGIDIQAQSNPTSTLQSGGNLNLVSSNGSVTSEIALDVAGQFLIAANGNINLGDYTGNSLQLTAINGSITAGTIDTSSATGDGGTVTLIGNRGIAISAINTFSTAAVGNGGAVRLSTSNGNIVVNAIDTASVNNNGGAVTGSAVGQISVGEINTLSETTGTGGAVTLAGNQGITTATIDTSSVDGSGGSITLVSSQGGINTTAGELIANVGLDGGSGGAVVLQAARDVTVGSISTDGGALGRGNPIAISSGGNVTIAANQVLNSGTFGVGPGGEISIEGRSVLINAGAQLISGTSASGDSGNIRIQAANTGRIQIEPGSILDAAAVGDTTTGAAAAIRLTGGSLVLTGTDLYADVLNGDGAGGQVSLTATTGGISFVDSVIYADTIGAGASGNVSLTALAGGITTTNSTILTSSQGSGFAGNISLSGQTINSTNSTFDAAAFGSGGTGNITIAAQNNGSVFLSGEIFADTFESNTRNGGNVSIRGGNVVLNGFTLDATSRGTVNGSNIAIEANNQVVLENGSALITTVDQNATGEGGDITLSANSITLSGASTINAGTNGPGRGGDIRLSAPTIQLTQQSEINAKTGASGQAGSIAIDGTALNLDTDSRISAAVELAAGNGGQIDINVRRLDLQRGGQLVSSTSGTGAAGSINIAASESVFISGRGTNPSGLFAQSTGAGRAGDLFIATPQLLVQDGAEVSVTTKGEGLGGRLTIATERLQVSGNGEISASTEGSGAGGVLSVNASRSVELATGGRLAAWSMGSGTAGSLDVTTNELSIRSGAELSTATIGSGNAGQVSVIANSLMVADGGKITSRSTGTGNAGSININVRDRLQMSAGEISASSEGGGGGQIAIAASNILLNRSSLISSSVSDGNGGGGNISIRARNSFFAFDDSDILANAQFGDGGTIIIDSPLFIADLFATVGRNPGQNFSRFRGNGRVDISASSVFGVSGTIQIPDISFIQNALTSLEGEFVVADQIVAGSCLARRSIGRSSFVVTGTGGLARTPYSQATSRYTIIPVKPVGRGVESPRSEGEQPAIATPAPDSTPHLSWKVGDPIQEAQGFIQTPDGRVVLGTNPQLVAVAKAQDLVCGF
ncbi:MAG: filamentous hemagglutinin N-terminal domain-containing protein [Leptolyngbyaceae cyanobacterium bins.302]|nr:filamentous hemagglutinin N-terminal domain-containing protein [Leptolyngbyaceae cyanobacterium bins.302]